MRVMVLGASGLIGGALARSLARKGFEVVAVARGPLRLPDPSERVRAPFVDLDVDGLRALLEAHSPDVVVNATGVLQDAPGVSTHDAHTGFVGRLVEAMGGMKSPPRLVHLSIPGNETDDETAFARTKREADARIAASSLDHLVLRPGFVIADGAYGGSALVRALAASPLDLPPHFAKRPFAVTDVEDIADTVAWLAHAETTPNAVWDVLNDEPTSLGDVVAAHREWLGGPRARLVPPAWLANIGAELSDAAAWLGWRPPTRSTALAELRRGIAGNSEPWQDATGLAPTSLQEALSRRSATVADRWFARLYPLKALTIAVLAVFWAVSGTIAFVSYGEARAILVAAGFGEALSHFVTFTSSALDIVIGAMIAWRRTARAGLWLGIATALFYMAGAAILTPAMWLEPLGALVKTFPAIVLMGVALATLDDR